MKLDQQLAVLKVTKQLTLRKHKTKMQHLAEVKTGYNRFKVRRMKHGWKGYAVALREASQKEIAVYERMREALAAIGEELPEEVQEEIVEKLETAAPEPVAAEVVEAAVDEGEKKAVVEDEAEPDTGVGPAQSLELRNPFFDDV
jgi:truncated hemoglobin YjbI